MTTRLNLSLIVAYSRNRVIGMNNQLPWYLPQDLAHFKRTTLGSPVIMGRKTWQSIGRPLPGRTNIVLSRDAAFGADGAIVARDLEAAMSACETATKAFVIGGAHVYKQALNYAQEIIATEIDCDIAGDAFFPLLPSFQWQQVQRLPQSATAISKTDPTPVRYDFVTYQRR